jgi:hypothetical protein
MSLFDDLLIADDDDFMGLGGVVQGAGKSPRPKKFRAGSRSTERKLNKIVASKKLKTPTGSLFNPITGKANVKVQAPGTGVKTAPVIGKTVVAHPVTGVMTTVPVVAHPTTGQPAAAIAQSGGRPHAVVPLKTVSRNRGMLGSALPFDPTTDVSGTAGTPGTDADGNPTQGTDQYGVPAGWQPQNQAWLSGDLWAGNPNAWTFGGVRAQFRIAYPAINLSQLLNWSQTQEYGRVDPYNRTYDNSPSIGRDEFADQYALDDLRWDLHPPTQTVLGIARIPTHLLLLGDPNVADWSGAGGNDAGLNIMGVQFGPIRNRNFRDWGSDDFQNAAYLGQNPIDAGSVMFVKVPADYWKLDLSDGSPDWFHPGLPIPVDLLSWYAAKMVPDQSQEKDPDKFWGAFRAVYPYQFGVSGGMLPALGKNDDGTSDSEHGGRGSLTVYTDPADFPAHTAGIGTMPVAPAGPAPTPAPASDPNIDPSTGLPWQDPYIDPSTGLPYDTGGMPPPDQQYPGYSDPYGYGPGYDPGYDPNPSGLVDDGYSVGTQTTAMPEQAAASPLPSASEIDFDDSEVYADEDFDYGDQFEHQAEQLQPYGTEEEDFAVVQDDLPDDYFEDEELIDDFQSNDNGDDTGF